ncbi:putative RNA methyltransferase [Saccharopolyspora flava]|uniref:putative RNA methyltransferase n=1 Tax=Saccharopolyspora flava TaxID=95161 RepID=UPI001FEAE835|nr:23S rRNA methyltransferase [Saccharopolyspora flava]
MEGKAVLDDVVELLACPHCGGDLGRDGGALRCPSNHAFDFARQGYVSLLSGRSKVVGDTAEMVAARAGFLEAGHYDPIADAVADAVTGDGPVVDIGAGTGFYLNRALGERLGVALDVSKYACRRAAKVHPRIGAAVADAWQPLPIRTGAAGTVLNVFAPRNAPEMRRALRPGGELVVVTPEPGHLTGLVDRLGLLHVDESKQDRLADRLAGHFTPVDQRAVEFRLHLTRDEARAAIAMGPNAWHTTPEALDAAIAELPAPLVPAVAVTVARYRRV